MSIMIEITSHEDKMLEAAIELVIEMQFSVQAAMKKNNLNQKKLAELVGCSASNISQMLADDANPRIETIARALSAMGEEFKFVTETLSGELFQVDLECKSLFGSEIGTNKFYDDKEFGPNENKHEGIEIRKIKVKNRANDNDWYDRISFNPRLALESLCA